MSSSEARHSCAVRSPRFLNPELVNSFILFSYVPFVFRDVLALAQSQPSPLPTKNKWQMEKNNEPSQHFTTSWGQSNSNHSIRNPFHTSLPCSRCQVQCCMCKLCIGHPKATHSLERPRDERKIYEENI